MKVINSPIAHLIEEMIVSKIGVFYFFKDFIIAEFNEGSHVSYYECEDVMERGGNKYQLKPIGFISNRINSYSINVIDVFQNSLFLTNVKAYAIVYYSEITRNILEMEDQYFSIPRPRFDNLIQASHWIQNEIRLKT
ncbi:MAG: hypothetical protein ABI295_06780 [Xanthomarina sp.]